MIKAHITQTHNELGSEIEYISIFPRIESLFKFIDVMERTYPCSISFYLTESDIIPSPAIAIVSAIRDIESYFMNTKHN